MRIKKIVTWVLTVAVIATLGVVGWQHIHNANAAQPKYRTAAVTREHIVATITATGTISPLKTVQVGSQVSGRVLELDADFNTRVKKGDVVAKIDPRLFESDVARAKASLASAKAGVTKAYAALAEAKRQSSRQLTLADQKLVARADAETASANATQAAAQVVAATADVTQAQAALEQAETNLAMTTIVSPIDGVVISRNVDVGQTVAASLSAPTLFTIAQDMTAMEVHTSVSESDVGTLTTDMPVQFNVDAFPGVTFAGKVTQIRNAPTTVQSVVTYDAVVHVENPDLKLRPGMTANVTFVVSDRKDVLAVPGAALRFTPPTADKPARGKGATTQRVWTLDGVTPRAIEVKIGASDGRVFEIVSGDLEEGTPVIIGTEGGAAAKPANGASPASPNGGGQRKQSGGGGRGGLGM